MIRPMIKIPKKKFVIAPKNKNKDLTSKISQVSLLVSTRTNFSTLKFYMVVWLIALPFTLIVELILIFQN